MNISKIILSIISVVLVYEITIGITPSRTGMIGINSVPLNERYKYEPLNDKSLYKLPNGNYAIDDNYRGYKKYLDILGIKEYKKGYN